MRVLYYSPSPLLNLSNPAGYGTHMREIIRAMRELGNEVHPVIMGGLDEAEGRAAIGRTAVWRRFIKPFVPAYAWQTLKDCRLIAYDLAAGRRLAGEIRRFAPDAVYERGSYLQRSGVVEAERAGIPHVLEINCPYPEEKVELEGSSALLRRALAVEGECVRRTGHVVVVSSPLRDYLVRTHGIDPGKVSVFHNAIDVSLAQVDPARLAALRRQHGLEGCRVVGFVGSIQPWHGVGGLLDAFAEVARDHADLRLLIVGGGESFPELVARSAALGLKDRCIFAGSVPHREVFLHVAAMDVTVLAASKWYCSPIKIFEYGALGKLVIAPRTPAVEDVMIDGEDGMLVEQGPAALISALRRALADPAASARMAEAFQRKVLERHTWRRVAQDTLAVVDRLRAAR